MVESFNIMDHFLSLISYIYHQPYILLLLSILCAGILLTNYHYTKKLCELFLSGTGNNAINSDFDYGWHRGPHKWKEFFPAARGSYQSPINIRTETREILKISGPLMWRNYDDLPVKVTIENTGHTVEMTSQYGYKQPTLFGADLLESYSFVSLCFRWSALHNEGSEHSIDDSKYPLEMQVSHFSKENIMFSRDSVGSSRILMLSYLFTITQFDNPYLDPIILNLHRVREPFKQVKIPSFPLSWLCYPFKSNFYSYGGSLTEPPCTEGVTWFVQPEPMSITSTIQKALVQRSTNENIRKFATSSTFKFKDYLLQSLRSVPSIVANINRCRGAMVTRNPLKEIYVNYISVEK